MLKIEMLPATKGDCIWIEYGDRDDPRRVLIDGGTAKSSDALISRLERLPKDKRDFELLVISHVDDDHIAGVLEFFRTEGLGVRIREVWFNAYRHLLPEEQFGPPQGEALSAYIEGAALGWNTKFDGKAVVVPDEGPLQIKKLRGGLELVVLGPTRQKLAALQPVWEQACVDAGIIAGQATPEQPEGVEAFGVPDVPDVEALAGKKFIEDESASNGSSIVLLVRYDRARVLLSGDAHPSVIEAGLSRLSSDKGRIKLDAFQIPHHGSRHNLSSSLIERLDCRRFLFSSDGSYHHHPSAEAVARVLTRTDKRSIRLVFNYSSDEAMIWDSEVFKDTWRYRTTLPSKGRKGVIAFRRP